MKSVSLFAPLVPLMFQLNVSVVQDTQKHGCDRHCVVVVTISTECTG